MKHGTQYLFGVPASTFDHMLYREVLKLKLELVEHVIRFVQLYPPQYRDTSRLKACLEARTHTRALLDEKD